MKNIRFLLCLFVIGLVISGATAIPLVREVDWLASWRLNGPLAVWLTKVQTALHEVTERFPFLFYGTDWLAFGHFAIAIAFIGPLRDPIRNKWVIDFGIICCVLVIPWALIFGAVRGIPIWWRFIDCSFGVFGIIPLALCRRMITGVERQALNITYDPQSIV